MTTNESFERRVAAWLREDSENRLPDHLDEVLVQTISRRQRAWWSSRERWLPVDTTFTPRLTPLLRPAWLLIIAALLLVALVATILLVGSRPRLPPPYGTAANGVVVYGGSDGDIYAFDPATGTSRPFIAGPTRDIAPFFSRDGSMVVFARKTGIGNVSQLTLAKADGTLVRTLTGGLAESDIDWSSTLDWSPDGSRLAYIDARNTFSIVRVDGSSTHHLDLGMRAEDVRWRPNGSELIFRGVGSAGGADTVGLFVVGAAGTILRVILPPTSTQEHWQEPSLSPDGNRIIYTRWGLDGGHLHVVVVDSGDTE